MTRWQPPKTTAKQQRAAHHAQRFAQCRQGTHALTPTFRAGEQVCTTCGIVLYCPECLSIHHLPDTRATRAYPLACALHTNIEVQA